MALIAPSLLASNFLKLQEECEMLNNSSADWYHLDVMDGRFVPNISFGLPIVEQIRTITKKPLDVHLMIVEPEKYIIDFKNAGADHITIHYEACIHLHRNIEQIKSLGLKAGVALNPHTPIILLEDIITYVDIVLLMSVNPGFGGQKFIPNTVDKIRSLKKLIHQTGSQALIEIDGGVTVENAGALLHTGADVLVAGNTVFKSANPTETILKLKTSD
ncbi:MAG: ribulose-phosphate 3-epimerase [Bacteroidetes bacterium]|nr:ribulose-phosphate 3-epimerase [Bacteroidota bacterium]MBS1649851.1 ribulose-phosphate 3-epimerase [Bacteroidota bacterium]